MFMFPEPPPIDYYITDVSATYLSDGVFHHGRPAPTHKYVAKQLKPIKRTLSDPIAPVEELDPRVLNQCIKKEKEGFVDPPGRGDRTVFEMLSLMAFFSVFPRSPQYELHGIRGRRLKNVEKLNTTMVECPEKEEISKTSTYDHPCHFLRQPFWWGGEAERCRKLSTGTINEPAHEKLNESEQKSRKNIEKLQMEHPRKYIPGVSYGMMKDPEDESVNEVLNKADSSKGDEKVPKNGPSIDECICPINKHPVVSVSRDAKRKEDAQRTDSRPSDTDTRWQSIYDKIGFPGTDVEREKELRELTKPFLHDLHAWYSGNKPTKFREPVKHKGKRPILERRFSHL
ncbi:PREDICTED: uncharacterized protein LOC107186469 [Dufourea novaeangliae]|uniref:uncharacterized protein LOC107186469 n=1 Tax=Dufourea novaeangliae TaxID=178035 RepID=UPI0007679A2E|nr:PREDICTED: uncharacterized protein LOC107186469 [Dufourea novaeangliae]